MYVPHIRSGSSIVLVGRGGRLPAGALLRRCADRANRAPVWGSDPEDLTRKRDRSETATGFGLHGLTLSACASAQQGRLRPEERPLRLIVATVAMLKDPPGYDVVIDDIAYRARVPRSLVYCYFAGVDDFLGQRDAGSLAPFAMTSKAWKSSETRSISRVW